MRRFRGGGVDHGGHVGGIAKANELGKLGIQRRGHHERVEFGYRAPEATEWGRQTTAGRLGLQLVDLRRATGNSLTAVPDHDDRACDTGMPRADPRVVGDRELAAGLELHPTQPAGADRGPILEQALDRGANRERRRRAPQGPAHVRDSGAVGKQVPARHMSGRRPCLRCCSRITMLFSRCSGRTFSQVLSTYRTR